MKRSPLLLFAFFCTQTKFSLSYLMTLQVNAFSSNLWFLCHHWSSSFHQSLGLSVQDQSLVYALGYKLKKVAQRKHLEAQKKKAFRVFQVVVGYCGCFLANAKSLLSVSSLISSSHSFPLFSFPFFWYCLPNKTI